MQEREGLVDVGAPFVADGQAAGAVEPGMAALDHPAVPPEPVTSLDAASGNPRRDPPCPALPTPRSGIIGLVGVRLVGALAGASTPSVAQGGMASTVRAISGLSWQLAPVRTRPSGVTRASVIRWRLVPALPRSVGFGPVADPLFWPARSRCRRSLGSSRSHPPPVGARAGPDASAATRRPLASRAAGANSSCRSRISSRPAASPRGCPSAARTECRSGQPDRPSGGARPSGEAGGAAEAGRSQPRDRQGEAGEPYHPNAQPTQSCRSVRRS